MLPLQELHDLRIIDVRSSSTSLGFLDGYPYSYFGEVLDNNQKPLRKIALNGATFRANSSQFSSIAGSLTYLAINGVQGLHELEMFLRQATTLESLTLLDITSLVFLPCTTDALPNLMDLKLGVDSLPGNDGLLETVDNRPDMLDLALSLLEFVRLHPNLRRFDFSLWPTRQYIDFDDVADDEILEGANARWFGYVLEAVCALHGVQALGITFPILGEYELLAALVKLGDDARSIRTCTSLRLGGVSDAQADSTFGELRRCTFLALSNSRPNGFILPKYPVPSVDELMFHFGLMELEQVCLGGQMFDVVPPHNIAEDGISAFPWSIERLRRRTEADFCSIDAHWLMSYRTVSRQYEHADVDDGFGGNEMVWEL